MVEFLAYTGLRASENAGTPIRSRLPLNVSIQDQITRLHETR